MGMEGRGRAQGEQNPTKKSFVLRYNTIDPKIVTEMGVMYEEK